MVNKIYFKTFISEEVENIYSPETKETVHSKQYIYDMFPQTESNKIRHRGKLTSVNISCDNVASYKYSNLTRRAMSEFILTAISLKSVSVIKIHHLYAVHVQVRTNEVISAPYVLLHFTLLYECIYVCICGFTYSICVALWLCAAIREFNSFYRFKSATRRLTFT